MFHRINNTRNTEALKTLQHAREPGQCGDGPGANQAELGRTICEIRPASIRRLAFYDRCAVF